MALADALHGLFRLPGATYACIVERDGGRVLAEVGRGEGSAGDAEGVVPYSVAGWGTAVAAMFDSTSGDELDDVMITGRRSYHLVRPLGAGAAVLVYVRLDRARSNLAAARRELAAVRWGAGTGASGQASTPAPSAVPRRAEPPRSGAEARAARGGAEPRAARTVGGPRGARAAAESRTGRGAVPSPPPSPPSRVPAALPPTGTPGGGLPRAGRAAPSTRAGSGSVSDGPGPQIPLPRRAPTQRPPAVPRRRTATRVSAASTEGSAVPEGFTMPAVLGQSWARDPGTLRRLIAGLRRLA